MGFEPILPACCGNWKLRNWHKVKFLKPYQKLKKKRLIRANILQPKIWHRYFWILLQINSKKRKLQKLQWESSNAKDQWFSKCVPWASSISITWELVRNANHGAPSRPPESETLGVGLRNLCFNKASRGFWWSVGSPAIEEWASHQLWGMTLPNNSPLLPRRYQLRCSCHQMRSPLPFPVGVMFKAPGYTPSFLNAFPPRSLALPALPPPLGLSP